MQSTACTHTYHSRRKRLQLLLVYLVSRLPWSVNSEFKEYQLKYSTFTTRFLQKWGQGLTLYAPGMSS